MLTALGALGVRVDDGGRGALPFAVRGTGSVPGGTVTIDASASSQFVSALLLAGARYDHGVDVRHVGKPVPSLPHIEMTVQMLRQHGVEVDDSDANRWSVAPGPIRRRRPRHRARPVQRGPVPRARGRHRRPGHASPTGPRATTQPGDELREILTLHGLRGEPDRRRTSPWPDRRRLSGVDLDLHDVGELTPAVAALCALADSPSHLRGIAHIRGHETDRLAALATELGRLGADVDRARGRAHDPAGAPARRRRSAPTPTTGWRTPGSSSASAVDGVLVEDVAHHGQDLPRLRRARGAGRARVRGRLRDDRALLRPRPRALRAPAPPHPPPHQGPPDLRRRRRAAASSPSTAAASPCSSTATG